MHRVNDTLLAPDYVLPPWMSMGIIFHPWQLCHPPMTLKPMDNSILLQSMLTANKSTQQDHSQLRQPNYQDGNTVAPLLPA